MAVLNYNSTPLYCCCSFTFSDLIIWIWLRTRLSPASSLTVFGCCSRCPFSRCTLSICSCAVSGVDGASVSCILRSNAATSAFSAFNSSSFLPYPADRFLQNRNVPLVAYILCLVLFHDFVYCSSVFCKFIDAALVAIIAINRYFFSNRPTSEGDCPRQGKAFESNSKGIE